MKKKIGSLVISVLAALLVSFPVYILEEEFNQEHSKDVRLTASRELTRIKEVMQADLQSALNYAHFLELIIQQDPDFEVDDFRIYAEMILSENDFVSSVVFAPKGVISFIYPVTQRNNQFIGQDLLSDPEKKLSTQYAVDNRTAVVQGPFEEAGTLIVYNRQPIFIEDEFFGFVSVGVNFYQLLEAHDIEEQVGDILLALQVNSELNPNPSTVSWGNVSIFEEEPETDVLDLSGEEWVLAAYPIGGWNKRSLQFFPSHAAFFFVWVVAFVLLYLLNITYWNRREEAYHDGLTQTLNKKSFENYVKLRLKNNKGKDALLLIDINDFKLINDQYGHAVGDQVLVVISERLRKYVRKTDKVGRIGGDEFMLYLHDYNSEEHLDTFITNLCDAVSQPIRCGEHILSVTIAVGWAFTNSGVAFGDIYSLADEGMYKEKCKNKEPFLVKNSE